MNYVVGYIVGFLSGGLLVWVILGILDIERKSKSPDIRGIGTLYIYEGEGRDRYSFAFDCPLDQIGNYKEVILEVKKQRTKTLEEIENDYNLCAPPN